MSDNPLTDIATLTKNLIEAESQLRDICLQMQHLRSKECSALNNANAAQKALDKFVAKLREASPSGTDWKRRGAEG